MVLHATAGKKPLDLLLSYQRRLQAASGKQQETKRFAILMFHKEQYTHHKEQYTHHKEQCTHHKEQYTLYKEQYTHYKEK